MKLISDFFGGIGKTGRTVIFYHSGCMDGIISALNYDRMVEEGRLYPLTYNDPKMFDIVSEAVHEMSLDGAPSSVDVIFTDITPDGPTIDLFKKDFANPDGIVGTLLISDHHPGIEDRLKYLANLAARSWMEQSNSTASFRRTAPYEDGNIAIHAEAVTTGKKLRCVISCIGDNVAGAGLSLAVGKIIKPTGLFLFPEISRIANRYDLWRHEGKFETPETRLSLVFYKHYKKVREEVRQLAKDAFEGGMWKSKIREIRSILRGVYKAVAEEFIVADGGYDLVRELIAKIKDQRPMEMRVIEVKNKLFGNLIVVTGDFDPNLRNETATFLKELDYQTAAVSQWYIINPKLVSFSNRQSNPINFKAPGIEEPLSFSLDMDVFSRVLTGGGSNATGGAKMAMEEVTNDAIEDALVRATLTSIQTELDKLKAIHGDAIDIGTLECNVAICDFSNYQGEDGKSYRAEGDIIYLDQGYTTVLNGKKGY